MIRPTRRQTAATLMVWSALAGPLAAATPHRLGPAWHDEKCSVYARAWTQALARQGSRGLGQPFLREHAAFLASNCTRRAEVCARSDEEIKLANTLTVLSMNAGMASTFVPFYCRD